MQEALYAEEVKGDPAAALMRKFPPSIGKKMA